MPKARRTKQVQYDNATFVIGALTLDQVEEYVAPIEDIEANKGAGKIKTYDLLCNGLNNGLPDGTPAEEQWTHAKLRAELDMLLVDFLQREILAFSGFKMLDEEKVAVPGELGAAASGDKSQNAVPENLPASTSGTSAAA